MPAGHTPTREAYEILKRVYGYDEFRRGQERCVTALLEGRNLLAVMPTGSGKSLCFQVPALVKGGLTVVVSPLVALMQDQVAALKLLGVAAETINSALSREENVAAWQRAAAGEVRLLYLAPERLMSERMIAALSRLDIRMIAVDEAHCISQWGPAFRPEYEALSRLRTLFPGVPLGAFTATADEATRQDILARLLGPQAEVYVAGFDRPNIRLAVNPKRNSSRQLIDFLEDHQGESGIVYALSRKSTEQWAEFLVGKGHRALAYHAGLTAGQRDDAQQAFMAEKGVIVCATIAFGMGIDKPDVRFVFHADLPGSLDAYYQEIGRAGRDGLPAVAQMVYGLQDIRMRRMFINEEDAGEERKRREHKRLDALISYCEAPACRRQTLLGYFGEDSAPCGNCDGCLTPSPTFDGTVEAQKILSAVHRTGQRFGAQHIADVIEGKKTEKVTALGHDRLPTFGVGKDHPREEWLSLVRQLVAGGFLLLDVAGHGGISISDKGRSLLKGGEQFRYRRDMMPKAAKREQRRAAPAPSSPPPPREAGEDELLQRLKNLRMALARARNVPAFVIMSDRSLIEMTAKKPRTVEDFGQIHGVGEVKTAQFASAFLRAISQA